MRLNGVTDADLFPKLRHGDIEARPIEEVAPHVSALVTAGLMTPDDTTEEWLREILGAPQVETSGIDRAKHIRYTGRRGGRYARGNVAD